MGWRYLGGLNWAEVTRDERYFCQQLFAVVQRRGEREFVELVNRNAGLSLPSGVDWELGYEVCFFRDLWQLRGREERLHSPKRTFDLCLFSERQIVIIEAKAQQGFDKDLPQLQAFGKDKARVGQLTGVEEVLLVGLASSRYIEGNAKSGVWKHFDGQPLSWRQLADHYRGEAEADSLDRADAIYERDAGGKHNEGRLSGEALVAAHAEGRRFQVGRAGGPKGQAFAKDVESGRWRGQLYETSCKPLDALNGNWFSLDEFASAVGRGATHGA